MNIATIKGRGSSEHGESVFLHVYNGTGSAVAVGDPLCFDVVSSDGKTGTQPTIGTNSSNFAMFAGFAQEIIGTADYSARVQAYGLASAAVYGISTTLVPGSYLALVDGKDYMAYGASGAFSGSTATAQPITTTALGTNATVDTTVQNVFVKAL